jgi:hypothetical protein
MDQVKIQEFKQLQINNKKEKYQLLTEQHLWTHNNNRYQLNNKQNEIF